MLQGCIMGSSTYRSNEKFDIADFKEDLVSGMSKQGILDLLGPPIAIAKKNGSLLYLQDTVTGKNMIRHPDVFLELFSGKHALHENHRVYFYQTFSRETSGVAVVTFSSSSSTTEVKKLWILIDDKTQRVVDYIFKEE